MYRSFEAPQPQMQGDNEEAYPLRYVTELATQQMGLRRSNPSGNGNFDASHCRVVSHIAPAAMLLPRSSICGKIAVAIGAAGSSGAP
jgi:hypothetical protein